MKNTLYILCFLSIVSLFGQSKVDYLKQHRYDLHQTNFHFPQKSMKLVGFGAYHGSAKTEDTELLLLRSLLKNKSVQYYLPETDFSIGHFFNEYLQTGDTLLLKDLVTHYGTRVPQDRSIETYSKWIALKNLNDSLPQKDRLQVVGIDLLVSYKYVSKHLLQLLSPKDAPTKALSDLQRMIAVDTTDYSIQYDSYAKNILKKLLKDLRQHQAHYKISLARKKEFDHLVKNIQVTFEDFNRAREPTIYENYLTLSKWYNFKDKPQFLRMGFAHLEKSREGTDGYPYFFTRLIENKIYTEEEVISVIGYLTNSRVVWDEKYDAQGNYSGFTTEGGFGIGDYDKEYFRGIQHLKDTKLSDQTLYRLNTLKSPYRKAEPDLIEIVMKDEASNGAAVKGMATTHFIDYAVLISDSKASTPIFEIK